MDLFLNKDRYTVLHSNYQILKVLGVIFTEGFCEDQLVSH
jgi:hypothetical protein